MVVDRDMVIVAFPTWEGNYVKSTVELVKALGQTNRKILYIDYQPTLIDVLKNSVLRRKSILGESKTSGNTTIITPYPALPINWLPLGTIHTVFRKFNSWIYNLSLKKFSRRLKLNSPVFIHAFSPITSIDIVTKHPENKHIYYCYDQISHAPWIAKHGTYLEKVLINKVDQTIVTSQGLLNDKSKLTSKIATVKNGVAFDIFTGGFSSQKTEKKVGYIGSIDDRIDLNLIKSLTSNLPDVTFTFIGRIVCDKAHSFLKGINNIEIIPPTSPEQLATHLKDICIGLIPFVKNEFTRNIYPLKVNEYLAAGLAVSSTNFANLDDFKDIILISDDYQEQIEYIRKNLESNEAMMRQRQSFAEKNSWKHRAIKELNPIINSI